MCCFGALHFAVDQHPIFIDITKQSKLNFIHDSQVSGKYVFAEIMGSGCALFDYDNDGYLDIYFVNGTNDHLFRQNSDHTFTDVSNTSHLNDNGYGMGVAIGDIDNDGDLDVLVTNYGPDHLYRNNGDGTFTDITKQASIDTSGWSTSAVFFDYNRDGFLDLYIARYVKLDPSVICTDRAGRKDYCGPEGYEAEPDLFYRNNGNGTFTDVSKQSGITRFPMKGLGVAAADFNNDGYTDIYVANDRQPNHLWINQHDGTFKDYGLAMGTAVNALGQPEASMGIAVGDSDNDGLMDLFLTNLRDETNTFYHNAGVIGFEDRTAASGLDAPSLPYTGFGTGFFDYNNDGYLDIAVVNGRVTRGPLLTNKRPPSYWDYYVEPNLLFENLGNFRFRNASDHGGTFASDLQNSRGLAFGDIDNDGDVDLLVNNCGGPAQLYRNDFAPRGNWLMIRVIDPALKRDAISARITIVVNGKSIPRFVTPGYSYLSSSDFRVHFGLDSATSVERIVVDWPDGSKEIFPGVQANQSITLKKGK